jgi:hypothetical protein
MEHHYSRTIRKRDYDKSNRVPETEELLIDRVLKTLLVGYASC